MEPSDSIGRLGFRKWYERQLLEAHAWLVTCLLSGFGVFACLEQFTFRDGMPRALALAAFMLAGIAIGAYALARYGAMMVEAQRLAGRSVCPQCGTYGRFLVARVPRGEVMDVRCRQCSAAWTID